MRYCEELRESNMENPQVTIGSDTASKADLIAFQRAETRTVITQAAAESPASASLPLPPPRATGGSPVLDPGAVVGKYQIVREIGRGGQGRVFLAVDQKLRRQVALKTENVTRTEGEEWLNRFRNEARTLARLDHPNIVQVYEAFQVGGQPFFAMEYVEGDSLAEVMQQNRLSTWQLVEVIATCCDAVAFAHTQGVIHRDLKPENILIARDGKPKITDFGLARDVQQDAMRTAATLDGVVLGSPAYMAPEQANGRSDHIGPHTDVYSIGTMLYEILTHRLPFCADTPMAMLLQIVREEPEPAIKVNTTLDHDLNAICMKAIEKDPADRFPNAAEMAADLHRYLSYEPVLARAAPVTARFAKGLRRNRDLAAISGIALTFMAIALAMSITWFARLSASSVTEALHTELRSVADTAAMMFSAEELARLRTPDDEKSETFRNVVNRLNEIRRRNLRVRNAYILRRSDDTGQLNFVADADAFLGAGVTARANHVGAPHRTSHSARFMRAFQWQQTLPKPVVFESDGILSGYAAITRQKGTPAAVLCLDISTEQVQRLMAPVLRTTAQVSGLGAVGFMGLAAVAGVRVMRRQRRRN